MMNVRKEENMSTAADATEWIKTSDAASIAEVTQHTIRAWIQRAPKIGKRVGGRWRVRKEAIEKIAAGKALIEDFEERTDE